MANGEERRRITMDNGSGQITLIFSRGNRDEIVIYVSPVGTTTSHHHKSFLSAHNFFLRMVGKLYLAGYR